MAFEARGKARQKDSDRTDQLCITWTAGYYGHSGDTAARSFRCDDYVRDLQSPGCRGIYCTRRSRRSIH